MKPASPLSCLALPGRKAITGGVGVAAATKGIPLSCRALPGGALRTKVVGVASRVRVESRASRASRARAARAASLGVAGAVASPVNGSEEILGAEIKLSLVYCE